jgi:hypothetical protein
MGSPNFLSLFLCLGELHDIMALTERLKHTIANVLNSQLMEEARRVRWIPYALTR